MFDCATGSLLSSLISSDFWTIQDTTQVYQDKIFTDQGIVHANTSKFISQFNIADVRAFDLSKSIVYGLKVRPTDWNNYSDWSTGSKYYFQEINGLTNQVIASTNKEFRYDDGKSAAVNHQTGEIYLGGETGQLYILNVTNQPLVSITPQKTGPSESTDQTLIILAAVVIIAFALVGTAIVLRRRK